jgi:hypothetical protein
MAENDEARAAKIFNGKFTLVWPDGDTHRTFRIRTQPDAATQLRNKPNREPFAPGKRIVALMTGSDNMASYTNFGFVDDRGIYVWKSTAAKRTKAWHDGKLIGYIAGLWSLATEGEKSRFYEKGYRLVAEERCIVCNRTLTNPLSLRRGIGPECYGRRQAQLPTVEIDPNERDDN